MRKILTYGGFFESFINTLPQDVVKKIDYGLILLKTQDRIPNKYVKHIKEGPKDAKERVRKSNEN